MAVSVYVVEVKIEGSDQAFMINRVATSFIEEALQSVARQLPHFPLGKERDVTITIRKVNSDGIK